MGRESSRSRLVGRDTELAALFRRLADAGRGEGGLALLSGEPGIGKTRLLAELAERARAAGWRVGAGRAAELEGTPPYLAVTEALRQLIGGVPAAELAPALGRDGGELARLVPEVREALPDPPPLPGPGSEDERYRLFAAVAHFLAQLATGGDGPGVLVLLDDLHWGDRPTLLLLQHLGHALRDSRALIVGAHRSAAADISPALADLLAEASRAGLAARVSLGPLPDEQAASLVADLAGGAAAPAVAEELFRTSGGNPFFLGELVRQLRADGRDLADPRAAAGWEVPEGVRQVVGRRLARLRPETRRLLRAAAVLGERFDGGVLAVAEPLEEDAFLDALDEAAAAGMLREAGEDATYAFAHALVREVLYAELGPMRRRRLHLRIAAAIERVYGGSAAAHLGELAAHYRRAGPAGDPERAIAYSLRAGEAARAVFAYEDAAAHWRAALELMEARGDDAGARAHLLERLGDVYVVGLDHAAGIACHERALALSAALGDADAVARLHLRLAGDLAPLPEVMGTHPAPDVARALEHYRAAEALLAGAPDAATEGRLYAGMGATALCAGRVAEALPWSGRAMALAERAGDAALWARAAFVRGLCLADTGELGAGLALWRRAWETADRLGEAETAFIAACCRGGQAVYLGDPRDAQAWFRRELAAARFARAPLQRRALLRQLAQAHVAAGELAEARRLLAEAGEDEFVGPQLAFRAGDWEAARRGWAAGRARARRAGHLWLVWLNDRDLARLHEVRGEPEAAEPLLREALAIGVEGGDLLVELAVRPQLALLLAGMGRPHDARPHVERCRQLLVAGEDWRGLAGRVALAEAVLAASEGDPAGAEERFATAVRVFRRYALPWEEAEALERWAGARLLGGRESAAGELFDRAVELYRRHGAGSPWIDRAQSLRARSVGGGATKRPAPSYPGGLSEREVEVLRLVAAGRSNPEIAAALVISLNTVYRHVTHLFQKTGAQNRVEAAAFARLHGLV